GSGRARRVRRADVLRRRRDVLRPGPARFRPRGTARDSLGPAVSAKGSVERQGGGGIRALRPASRATTARHSRFLIKTPPLGRPPGLPRLGPAHPDATTTLQRRRDVRRRAPRFARFALLAATGQAVRACGRRDHSRSPWRSGRGVGLDEETAGVARWSTASVARRTHARAACRARRANATALD